MAAHKAYRERYMTQLPRKKRNRLRIICMRRGMPTEGIRDTTRPLIRCQNQAAMARSSGSAPTAERTTRKMGGRMSIEKQRMKRKATVVCATLGRDTMWRSNAGAFGRGGRH